MFFQWTILNAFLFQYCLSIEIVMYNFYTGKIISHDFHTNFTNKLCDRDHMKFRWIVHMKFGWIVHMKFVLSDCHVKIMLISCGSSINLNVTWKIFACVVFEFISGDKQLTLFLMFYIIVRKTYCCKYSCMRQGTPCHWKTLKWSNIELHDKYSSRHIMSKNMTLTNFSILESLILFLPSKICLSVPKFKVILLHRLTLWIKNYVS